LYVLEDVWETISVTQFGQPWREKLKMHLKSKTFELLDRES